MTELKEWLIENGVTDVAMESTGVYWKPVMNVLEGPELRVWIVNARHIKYVPGHKTDKKDSAWICQLLLAGLLKKSYVPPREQRELRDLTRYRKKLIQNIASEKNRIIRILEDCNVKLDSVISSLEGVTGTALIDLLISNGEVTMEDIDAVYHKKLKASKELLFEACNGKIGEHHKYMLQMIRKDIEQTQRLIDELTFRIAVVLAPYNSALEALSEIPGIEGRPLRTLLPRLALTWNSSRPRRIWHRGQAYAPGTTSPQVKKKLKDQPREQTSEVHHHGSGLGRDENERHILLSTISQTGGPQRKETGISCCRTFDPESRLAYPA